MDFMDYSEIIDKIPEAEKPEILRLLRALDEARRVEARRHVEHADADQQHSGDHGGSGYGHGESPQLRELGHGHFLRKGKHEQWIRTKRVRAVTT